MTESPQTEELSRRTSYKHKLYVANMTTLDRRILESATLPVVEAVPAKKTSSWKRAFNVIPARFFKKEVVLKPSVVPSKPEDSDDEDVLANGLLQTDVDLQQIDMDTSQLDALDQLREQGLKTSLNRDKSHSLRVANVIESDLGEEISVQVSHVSINATPMQGVLVVEADDWQSLDSLDVVSRPEMEQRTNQPIQESNVQPTQLNIISTEMQQRSNAPIQDAPQSETKELLELKLNGTVDLENQENVHSKHGCKGCMKSSTLGFVKFFKPPKRPSEGNTIQFVAYIWSTLQMIILGGMQIAIMVVWFQQVIWLERTFDGRIGSGRAVLTYMFLMICALIFQWILFLDTNNRSSSIQTIALFVFETCIFIYGILQYFQEFILSENDLVIIHTLYPEFEYLPTQELEIAFAVLAGIFWAGWMYLCWYLVAVYGWEVYRKFGADVLLRTRVIWTHVFETLLKLDGFFFIALDIQIVVLVIAFRNQTGEDSPDYDQVVLRELLQNLLLVLPITIVSLLLGYIGITRSKKWVMWLFLVFLLAAEIYLAFKLADIYSPTTDPLKYEDSKKGLTLFSAYFNGQLTKKVVITMLLGLATFVAAIMNLIYFEKVPGTLKQAQSVADSRNKGDRWEIDD
jgi:hypothetical protein